MWPEPSSTAARVPGRPRPVSDRRQIALVGAGPRGFSVLERLCANERAAGTGSPVTVHVIDPAVPGAGHVWRSGQSRHLLMNTVASQVTMFTDESVSIEGPIEPGPSLHTWACDVARGARLADSPLDPSFLDEARSLGPDSYPTRAFYGCYLRDCFQRVIAQAPAHVTVQVHRSRAVAMADTDGLPDGRQALRLEDGERLNDLDAIVLAQGHLPARPRPNEARAASLARIHHLSYVQPGNPADRDLDEVAAGETVLLRGLGLNFFDHMAIFTIGRGGTFETRGDRLAYLPSGYEPRMVAFSRRGVPYHARGENQKGVFGRHTPRFVTPELVGLLRAKRAAGERTSFAADLWPVICLEVESVYYGLLAQRAGRDRAEFTERFVHADGAAARGRLLDEMGIPAGERWDWQRVAYPCAGLEFADRAEFRRWLLRHLAEDVAAARAGNVDGPVKAALDVLRDLRNEVRLVVDHGGLDGDSYRDDLVGWYTPLNAYLSIGPPARRIEEMIALIEAGMLDVTGPHTRVRLDPSAPAFVAESVAVPGPPEPARTLIEARLPEADLRRTEDPLLRHLLGTGQCAPYRIDSASGECYETGGLAVTERPYRVVDARGRAHPRRFALGVPTEAVHWVTAAGIRPGVDSVSLGDSDAIARAVLDLRPVERVRLGPSQPGDDTELLELIV
jgi:hypothetical protein